MPMPAFMPPELTPLVASVVLVETSPAVQVYPHHSQAG